MRRAKAVLLLAGISLAMVWIAVAISGCGVNDTDWDDYDAEAGLEFGIDKPYLEISPGAPVSYTVQLTTTPVDSVVVHLYSGSPDTLQVSPDKLVLGGTTGVEVTVTYLHDSLPDSVASRTIQVIHQTESIDPNYDKRSFELDVRVVAMLAPVLESEPEFTPGVTNEVFWTWPPASARGRAVTFRAQCATDVDFLDIVEDEIDIPGGHTSYTFGDPTPLVSGQRYWYRVLADDGGVVSEWSNTVWSTQDADDPVATVNCDALQAQQPYTTTSVPVPYTATDETSSVVSVRVWYQQNGGGWIDAGFFPHVEGEDLPFEAPSGNYLLGLVLIAEDAMGNMEVPPFPWDSECDVLVDTEHDVQAPVLESEPEFTRGTENSVGWTWSPASAPGRAVTFRAQCATDALFVDIVEDVSDIQVTHTFHRFGGPTPLISGQTYWYRVLADDGGVESEWSNTVWSTQDADDPVATVNCIALQAEQPYTTTSVPVPYDASDVSSSVVSVHLWYQQEGGDWIDAGSFTPLPGEDLPFEAPSGNYLLGLELVAIDAAGNMEEQTWTSECDVDVNSP